jgi:hypothetical protein
MLIHPLRLRPLASTPPTPPPTLPTYLFPFPKLRPTGEAVVDAVVVVGVGVVVVVVVVVVL